jgi:hypothetical protein
MSVAFPVRTVADRLHRVQVLAAMLESFLPVIASEASNHDFLLDDEVFAGLAMVANVMREDLDSAEAVLGSEVLEMPAPIDPRDEAARAAGRRAARGAK